MEGADEEMVNIDNDNNPRPAQRQRTISEPYDDALANHVVFRYRIFREVSLAVLERDDAIQQNLNFKFLDVQILRWITSAQANANIYSRRKTAVNNNQVKFTRLIMAKIIFTGVHEEENSRVVYLMEARNQNKNLWSKNVNQRDNGAISVGSIIRIPCPMPVENYMRGDIPLIVSHQPAILLKFPRIMRPIAMNQEIEANTSLAFVYNEARVDLHFTAVVKTTCTGNLCDRQRISDWNGVKGCGCYGMSPNSSSLALIHAITITSSTGQVLKMDEFSSRKFSSLYLTEAIPGSVKLYMLQLTEGYLNMLSAANNCIDFINNNGGFTVIGWYKRGVINDKSLLASRTLSNIGISGSGNGTNNEENTQVDAGEISYHIVHLTPTNRDLLVPESILGAGLKEMKYDVRQIENTA